MLTANRQARPANFNEIWAELEQGIHQALAREPMSSKRYMELYTCCYNYCARANLDSGLGSSNNRGRNNRASSVNSQGNTSGKPVYCGYELYVRLRTILQTHLHGLTTVCK